MQSTRILFILALGATLSAETAAPGDRPKPKADATATVTVSAEATPVDLAKTPNPVKILTAETIERENPRNLFELLSAFFPGQIFANGGVGTVSSFQLGGARSQDVTITLDGIRLADPTAFGSVSPNFIGLLGIERVEVQKGPCSSRFGAEAMGGVVALYSAGSVTAGLSGQVDLGLGTQDIQRIRASAAYGFGRAWVRTAVGSGQEAQATSTARDYRNQGAFLSTGATLGENSLVTLTYRNTYQAVPIPYQTVSPTSRIFDENREAFNRNQQVIGTIRSTFTSNLLAELSLGHVDSQRGEPNDFAKHQEPFNGHRNQAVGSLSWDPSSLLGLTLGADGSEEFARASDYAGGLDQGEGRYLALNLEARSEPMSWLRLVGSFREQWFRQTFVFDKFQGIPAASESKGTYKLGANLLLPAGHRLYVSGGNGFGLPFLSAVMYQAKSLLDPGSWSYDPASFRPLAPERSRFIQAGWTWSSGPWSARAELSRTRFESLVYFDLNRYLYDNGQDIRIQGAEASLGYRTEIWGLEGFLRNQEARDEQAPEAQRFSTNAVIRRPFNIFALNGYIVQGSFRAEVRWGYSGSRYENFGGFPATLEASRTHFNDVAATFRYRVNVALDLALRAEHLLQRRWTVEEWKNRALDGRNDAYQIFGFPAQPRTLSLEAHYRF